jgi:hypothetical protein
LQWPSGSESLCVSFEGFEEIRKPAGKANLEKFSQDYFVRRVDNKILMQTKKEANLN